MGGEGDPLLSGQEGRGVIPLPPHHFFLKAGPVPAVFR